MFAFLVLCLISIVVAQRPQPCTTPPQWEARIHDINEQRQFRVEGRLSYDSIYHRERIVDEIDESTQQDFYDTLVLFDLRTEYIYNFKARNCTRREITRPWRDFGIRPNDTSYGEAFIGSSSIPGANVLVTNWGGNFTTPSNETIEFYSSWTFLECLPVSRTTFSRQSGISHLSFFDVTLGIRDPNRFIPRPECLSANEWINRYNLFGTPTKKNI